jgi:hypothetical protein
MSRSPAAADDAIQKKGAALKDAAALWQFVRNDPVGRWLGIAWAGVAWFALTWLSLVVALMLVLLTVVLVVLQRRRGEIAFEDDLEDLM